MMRVRVEAAGVLAPGLPDWDAARAVLAGSGAYLPGPMPPIEATSLPPAERRRSSPTVRLAIAAAEQALRGTPRAPQDMALVFASYEAAGVITHQLCEVLAGTREVSPTQFHNSVHNAPSGYYSIAKGVKRAASSVCRGRWSFAAGLVCAAATACADDTPVLFVCYDSPLPAPLSAVMPILESTAIALVIAPAGAKGTQDACAPLGVWDVQLAPGDGEAAWPGWMPASWHANASTRGFAALSTLCGGADRAHLPYSPELSVQVTRC
jgi:hypothetical protein